MNQRISVFARAILLIAPLLLLLSPRAFAFSRVGHETIADLAYQSPDLTPKAKAAIDALLAGQDPLHPGQNQTIADAAEWPDEIKSPFGVYSKETWAVAFRTAHPEHGKWHFVNFPVGSTKYDPEKKKADGTAYADGPNIVMAVQGCVAVLEGKGTFDGLTKLDALRYLVHLVGDAHQPLHTINGYFDIADPTKPTLYKGTKKIPATAWADSGGNNLYYQDDDKHELHAMWDADIVNAIAGEDTGKLVTALTSSVAAKNYPSKGDYHDWIIEWVSDSMVQAREAYKPIVFNKVVTFPNGTSTTQGISITLPSTYIQDQVPVLKLQIIKGGTHLLQLFNAIQWQP